MVRVPVGVDGAAAHVLRTVVLGFVLLVVAGTGSRALAATCEGLLATRAPDLTVSSAESIPAGAYKPPGSPVAFADLPAFCRVVAVMHPVPESSIGIELWLPIAGWNGRYQQVGAHALAGKIFWNEMAPQLRRGFAVGATDNGHVATADPFGVGFAVGRPASIEDLTWRAVHELAQKAKLFIAAYYADPLRSSYFNGCSNGGREGLREAQAFPGDFDGILVGGAATHWTGAATQQLILSLNLKKAGIQGERGAAILALAQAAATKACDGLDGVVDGVIGDPARCRWDPHALVCKAGASSPDCITRAQADALAANLRDVRDPATGRWVMSGAAMGSEFSQVVSGYHRSVTPFGLANYRLAKNDLAWDGSDFDLHADLPKLERALGRADSHDPDLRAFAARGGKLIQYQGWADAAFTPGAAMKYYDEVVAKTGGGDLAKVQAFYRLFMQPGIGHCRGGPGANNIGQEGETAVSDDPDHDVVSALVAWVEQGAAPRKLIATKFRNDDPKQGVQMQRPLYPYPAEAAWNGRGDTAKAENFHMAPTHGRARP